jgi:ATP-dependent protease ClpP protease subunit
MIYDVHEFGVLLDNREIFLNSHFNLEEECIDHRCASTFIRNLRILNHLGDSPILIHSITCGGAWNYGIAIYDAILHSSSDTVVLSHAHARSMSSIIPQAANWRVIMPNADFLIHWGSLGFNGNYSSAIAEADWCKKLSEIMLDIYVKRCKDGEFWKAEGITEVADIKAYLEEQMNKKQEFYMTARQAVEFGFMDAVLGDPEFESVAALRNEV